MTGAGGDSAAPDVVPPVEEEVLTGGAAVPMEVVRPVVDDAVVILSRSVISPLSLGPDRVGPERDPPAAVGEAVNLLSFVSQLESEVFSVFDRHRELAAAAHWRSSSVPVVWLFVDFEMFLVGTGFGAVQAQALWDRWMGTVSRDRIYRANTICVGLHDLPRD
jgi:hypothetical protein